MKKVREGRNGGGGEKEIEEGREFKIYGEGTEKGRKRKREKKRERK